MIYNYKANHLKPTSAWLLIPYDQNCCVSKIQPNTQKRDGRRRFYRTINRLKMHTTKTQVMWNQVGLKKNQYYWGYIFFSVLERCLNLSHVTTMQVLLWVSLRPYILLMIYSHYPFKSFFFILNIIPFYSGNSKWNTCLKSENIICATTS